MNAARDTASSRIRTGKATPSDLKYAFRPTDDVARNGADGGGLAACAELLCRRKGTPSPNVASSPPTSRFGHSAADLSDASMRVRRCEQCVVVGRHPTQLGRLSQFLSKRAKVQLPTFLPVARLSRLWTVVTFRQACV